MITPSSTIRSTPPTRTTEEKSRSRRSTRRTGRAISNPQLTSREESLVALLESELSYEEIASRLGMRPNTMKSHMKNIFEKTGVRSRHGVVAWHLRRLLTPHETTVR